MNVNPRILIPLTTLLLVGLSPTPAQTENENPPPSAGDSAQGTTPRCAPLPSAPEDGKASPRSMWESLFDESTLPAPAEEPDRPDSGSFGHSPLSSPFPQSVVDPWRVLHEEMERMQRWQDNMLEEMDRQMDLFGSGGPGLNVQTFGFSSSGGELVDAGDHYEIALEMSGLDESTTSIHIEGNQLVLECVCRQDSSRTDSSGRSQSRSSFTNNLQRRWTLPSDVDRDAVEAKRSGESLRIVLPKLAGAQPTIEVPIH